MRATTLCLIASMALFAACSKTPTAPATPGGGGGGGPARVASAPSPMALIGGRPMRKPGLWMMTIATDSGPGIKLQGEICLNAETDRSSSFVVGQNARKDCGQPTFQRRGDGFAFQSTCKFGGRTLSTNGTVAGDFSSAYHMDVATHMDPPLPGGKGDVKTRIDAQWQGPCKPGQVPGKMSMKVSGFGRG